MIEKLIMVAVGTAFLLLVNYLIGRYIKSGNPAVVAYISKDSWDDFVSGKDDYMGCFTEKDLWPGGGRLNQTPGVYKVEIRKVDFLP